MIQHMKYPRIVYTDLTGLCCKVLDGLPMSADDLGRLEQEGWRDREAEGATRVTRSWLIVAFGDIV